MDQSPDIRSPAIPIQPGRYRWLAWATVVALLFAGFYGNLLGLADPERFSAFQYDSESLVMARLVESRQNGPLSHNGLLGWGDADPNSLGERDYQHQFSVYLSDGRFASYSVYKSASGAQALLLSLLDWLSPFAPSANLTIFHALAALLLSATIAFFIGWVDHEFSPGVALFVAVTSILSQWITYFGRSLFYFIWASFLPLGLTAWYLAKAPRARKGVDVGLAIVASAAILFKCFLNGYDFIIPAMAMPVVPFIYYAIRDHWDPRRFFTRASLLLLGLILAIAISMLVLSAQLQVSEGSLEAGFMTLLDTLGRRTYFPDAVTLPEYAAAVSEIPWITVLWTYISQDTAIHVLNLRFLDVLGLFAAVTAAYFALHLIHRDWLPDREKSVALIAATWLALLAPVAWFVVFKGQAVVHTHTNYLAWHMPFTLFGFAMTAWLVRCIGLALRGRTAISGAARPGNRPRP